MSRDNLLADIRKMFEIVQETVERQHIYKANCAYVKHHLTPELSALFKDYSHIKLIPPNWNDIISGAGASCHHRRDTGKFSGIFVSVFMSYEYFTTSLLHEIGHAIDFKERLPMLLDSQTNPVPYEIRAWKNAIRLSRKYNIPIDLDHAAQCLISYSCKKKNGKPARMRSFELLKAGLRSE